MISESFTPMNTPSDTDISGGYSELTKLSEGLFRAKKAGKFFILKTAKDTSARSRNLLKREYGLNATLSHPHIVNTFTFEENTPAGPAIVMEYVEGRTLDKFLQESPSKQDRNRIFLQLLDAVGYIHRKGLIHNDLKPQNIIITLKDNDLKLIDFGLSDDDSNFLENHLGGTQGYASPELRAKSDLDSRSDIYSIGMLMKDIFPTSLSHIKSRCTKADRNIRYSNIEALRHAYNHRNLPYRIAAIFTLIALILLPTILLFRERNKLAAANASISAIDNRNRIIDSIGTVLQQDFDTLYSACIKEINKEYELVNKGLHPWQTFHGELKDFGITSWRLLWVDGEQKISDRAKAITEQQGTTPEDKAYFSDAIRSRYHRIQEDTFQKIYNQSYDKAEFDKANKR